ncbi:MAG: cytochrome c oxidase subunit 3 [Bacteroidia bacterium]
MSAKKQGQKTEAVSAFQRLERMHPHKTFLFFAIVGSALAFLSLIFLYAIRIADVKITADFHFPKIFMVSTVLLLMSSYTLSRCARAFRNDEMIDLRVSLFITVMLATTFCVTQILGCKELYDAGIFINGQPGVAFLYLISGLHFVHVLGGIFALSYLNFNTYVASNDLVKQLLYFSSKREKNKIELVSIFWHFVDFVWVFLFFMFLFSL